MQGYMDGGGLAARFVRVGIAVAMLAALGVLAFGGSAGAVKQKAKGGCHGEVGTIFGDGKDNKLTGTNGPDVIVAKGGDDVIDGRGGKDLICAGGGSDFATGGHGKDRVFGSGSRDLLLGGAGDDKVVGQNGADLLGGDGGHDICRGGPGADLAAKRTCEKIRGAKGV